MNKINNLNKITSKQDKQGRQEEKQTGRQVGRQTGRQEEK